VSGLGPGSARYPSRYKPFKSTARGAHSAGAARVGTIQFERMAPTRRLLALRQLYNSREVQCGIFRVVG
jgi:hypothetical protein